MITNGSIKMQLVSALIMKKSTEPSKPAVSTSSGSAKLTEGEYFWRTFKTTRMDGSHARYPAAAIAMMQQQMMIIKPQLFMGVYWFPCFRNQNSPPPSWRRLIISDLLFHVSTSPTGLSTIYQPTAYRILGEKCSESFL